VKKHDARSASTNIAPLPGRHTRRRRVSLIRYLLLACLLAAAGRVFAASPLDLDIAMKTLTAAQAPRMVDDALILSYTPEHPVRFVGVRFSHESWKVLHPYAVNEHGVFVFDYPVPEGIREIRYRIVVDGLWMADPANPLVDSDTRGDEFSVFTMDKEPYRPTVNPRRERDGEITFTFRGAPGRRVSIAGDFNNWDPFMDYLAEKAPGTYTITFRMPAGRHWYFFFSDGQRIIDMANPETALDPGGNTVSYFALSS
jgi:1,4-alpha-glucan branching enzyme